MPNFNGSKYMTIGFMKLPEVIKLKVMEIIHEFVNESKDVERDIDYLQVIQLEVRVNESKLGNRMIQRLIHTQEQPEYKKVIEFECDNALSEKIFVICDEYPCEEIITFLLANER
jgi:precorrin isomerase